MQAQLGGEEGQRTRNPSGSLVTGIIGSDSRDRRVESRLN